MLDVAKAKKYFKEYTSGYDIENPRINLKLKHMYDVANNAKKIASSLKLSDEEQDLAEIIGLLHDIGRFEQVKWYDTFSDRKSIDHGTKGVEVLFADKHIRGFVEDDIYDNVIFKAINNHNKLEIEKGLSDYEILHCKIIRDADNIGIFQGLMTEKIETYGLYNIEDISKDILTPEFAEEFKKEKILLYSRAKTDIDIMVAIIAHIYALNFSQSYKMISENDYIRRFVKRINAQDDYTKSKLNEIADFAMDFINKKIKEN